MFFSDQRSQFFRPLTGKYREQVLECLRALYTRVYSSMADYSRALNRDQVIETLQQAVTRTPVLDDSDDEFQSPARGEREQANWVLNQLLDHGWIERLVDEATLQSTYALSRVGRLFTQPMLETATGRYRTRHRNTRNCRNALNAFVERGEVYDLLDAFEYSERIISDFSDVIAELDERKRQLVQEVEAQQVAQRASDEFFDFMEKRFMPDLAIRLSADSVEKYRDEIQGLLTQARRKKRPFKTGAERELRKLAPELLKQPGESLYLRLLDGIEARMHNASAVMLPALRQALHGFTRRADLIIRQLTYSGGQSTRLLEICQTLSSLEPEARDQRLEAAGGALASLRLALPDPDSLRLYTGRARRQVNTRAEEHPELDRGARRRLLLEQAVELAFSVNAQQLRDYMIAALHQGHRVHSQHLPVHDARELLLNAHAIAIGAADSGSSEFRFRVTPTGQQVRTDHFEQTDEFLIDLLTVDDTTAE